MNSFFKSKAFAVVGASSNPTKIGNQVVVKLKSIYSLDRIIPVNPQTLEIEGIKAIKSLEELVNPVDTSISVITPPKVTTEVVREAIQLGIRRIWLQPGAESPEAIQLAKNENIEMIYGGPCILLMAERLSRI